MHVCFVLVAWVVQTELGDLGELVSQRVSVIGHPAPYQKRRDELYSTIFNYQPTQNSGSEYRRQAPLGATHVCGSPGGQAELRVRLTGLEIRVGRLGREPGDTVRSDPPVWGEWTLLISAL